MNFCYYNNSKITKMAEIKLINNSYRWKNVSLWDFLKEGNIPQGWKSFFMTKDIQILLGKISDKLEKERSDRIYPIIQDVFRAFYMTPLSKIKVCILGQDPYHSGTNETNGSAMGLCFSVRPGNKINPSLRNIYRELKNEGYSPKEDGVLTHWTQFCFMYNMALTVEKGCADSHTSIWYDFSEEVIKYIAKNVKKMSWLLMGSKAQQIKNLLPKTHQIVCTSHPSPFSAHRSYRNIPAFLGSNAFKQIGGDFN